MIIGATLSATPYKIRTSQAEHFLRCGADILLNGLSRSIDGEGKCVICGTTTRLKMSEGRLQELDPETALLHMVLGNIGRQLHPLNSTERLSCSIQVFRTPLLRVLYHFTVSKSEGEAPSRTLIASSS